MYSNRPILEWAVSSSEKAAYDEIFKAWDVTRSGYIGGDKARAIFGNSQLPDADLFMIWSLADTQNSGRLNPDEFAVAMHLIQMRMAGHALPTQLPPELVPPSTRDLDSMANLLKYSLATAPSRTNRSPSINSSSSLSLANPVLRKSDDQTDVGAPDLGDLKARKAYIEAQLAERKQELVRVEAESRILRDSGNAKAESQRLEERRNHIQSQLRSAEQNIQITKAKFEALCTEKKGMEPPKALLREFEKRKATLDKLLKLVSEVKASARPQMQSNIAQRDKQALETMQTSLVSLFEQYKVEAGKRLSLAQQILDIKKSKAGCQVADQPASYSISAMIPTAEKGRDFSEDPIAAKARALLEQRMAALGISSSKAAPPPAGALVFPQFAAEQEKIDVMRKDQDCELRGLEDEISALQTKIETVLAPGQHVGGKVLDTIGDLKMRVDTLLSRLGHYASQTFFTSSNESIAVVSDAPAPPSEPPPSSTPSSAFSPVNSQSTNPFAQNIRQSVPDISPSNAKTEFSSKFPEIVPTGQSGAKALKSVETVKKETASLVSSDEFDNSFRSERDSIPRATSTVSSLISSFQTEQPSRSFSAKPSDFKPLKPEKALSSSSGSTFRGSSAAAVSGYSPSLEGPFKSRAGGSFGKNTVETKFQPKGISESARFDGGVKDLKGMSGPRIPSMKSAEERTKPAEGGNDTLNSSLSSKSALKVSLPTAIESSSNVIESSRNMIESSSNLSESKSNTSENMNNVKPSESKLKFNGTFNNLDSSNKALDYTKYANSKSNSLNLQSNVLNLDASGNLTSIESSQSIKTNEKVEDHFPVDSGISNIPSNQTSSILSKPSSTLGKMSSTLSKTSSILTKTRPPDVIVPNTDSAQIPRLNSPSTSKLGTGKPKDSSSNAMRKSYESPTTTAERIRQQVMGFRVDEDDSSDESDWSDSSNDISKKDSPKAVVKLEPTSLSAADSIAQYNSRNNDAKSDVSSKEASFKFEPRFTESKASTSNSAKAAPQTRTSTAQNTRNRQVEASKPDEDSDWSDSNDDESASSSASLRLPGKLAASSFAKPAGIAIPEESAKRDNAPAPTQTAAKWSNVTAADRTPRAGSVVSAKDSPPAKDASLGTKPLSKIGSLREKFSAVSSSESVPLTKPSRTLSTSSAASSNLNRTESSHVAKLSKTNAFLRENQHPPATSSLSKESTSVSVKSLKARMQAFQQPSAAESVMQKPSESVKRKSGGLAGLEQAKSDLQAFMPNQQNLEQLQAETSSNTEQIVEALWDYVPGKRDSSDSNHELELEAGRLYCMLESQGDWGYGYAKGNSQVAGWFPISFVAEASAAKTNARVQVAVLLYDFDAEAYPELSVKQGQLVHCQETTDYGHDWMWVSLKDEPQREGIVPSSYLSFGVPPTRVSSKPEKRFRTTSIHEKLDSSFTLQLESTIQMSHSRSHSNDQLARTAAVEPAPKRAAPAQTQQPKRPEMPRWTNCVSRDIASSLSEQDRKRQEAMFEIITTEQSYLHDLELLVGTLLPILRQHLKPDTVKVIAGNVEELLVASKRFCSDLVAMQQRDRFIIATIGPFFIENLKLLGGYKQYCAQQMVATKALEQARRDQARLQEALRHVQQSQPEFRHLDISSFLLEPMQRITRYALLLKQVLHYTGRYHQDHAPLTKALGLIESLLGEINDAASQVESDAQMAVLAKQLSVEGSGYRVMQLITSSIETRCLGKRLFVHQGSLVKAKSGRKLEALLFNDMLVLANKSGDVLQVYREPLPLNEIVARDVPPGTSSRDILSGSDEKSFQIVCGETITQYKAGSAAERAKWIKLLDQYCSAYRKAERALADGAFRQKSEREEAEKRARPPIGTLQLTIFEGMQLAAARSRGDVYTIVNLGEQQFKSRIVHDVDNPRWNQAVVFSLMSFSDPLSFSVYSYDKYTQDVLLGTTFIALDFLEFFGDKETDKITLNFVDTPRAHLVIKLSFHNI